MTVKRKNILMLITQMSMGGAERVFYDHAEAFSAEHNVIACVFTMAGFEPAFRSHYPVLELDDQPVKGSLQRFQYRKKRLETLVKEHRIDVCISHMEGANILLCWSRLGSCKKIICIHGSIKGDSGKHALKKAILNKAVLPLSYRRARSIVAVSRAMQEELISIGLPAAKVIAIPNFFDLGRIEALSREPLDTFAPIFEAGEVLIHVGRLSLQKNQRVLVDVMHGLKEKGIRKKLCIVGEGPLKSDLLQYAKERGLSVYDHETSDVPAGERDIYFLGKQTNPYRFMARAQAFLLSSFFEGFPLVLGESLACATPVIAVDCETGPREILSDDGSFRPQNKTYSDSVACGILVPDFYTNSLSPAQKNTWVTAIETLSDQPWYAAVKQACRQKVRQYSQEVIVEKWLQLIDNV
ncbi:glycosyltransferase [Flavisolibacter nicotianae]|uniref:glycosyltransferase n=1 Tax=Flavisolibacter nicotianae TaxID=2364882 RepID=UPI000EAE9525|nr:glycosyltransferase [Flavisolibacter nicotianae]